MGAHFLYVPVYLFLFDASMHNQFSYFFKMASTIKEVQIAVFDVEVKKVIQQYYQNRNRLAAFRNANINFRIGFQCILISLRVILSFQLFSLIANIMSLKHY